MANLIPNEETFVGFVVATASKPFGVANTASPSILEVNSAVDVTDYLISLNASATGNTVPTPRLKSLFETSVSGTSTATLSGDFYRDDEDDLAWDTFPRRTRGSLIIKRFGGTGPERRPAVAEECEVWPMGVTSRAAANLQSGMAQMFTMTANVPKEPAETAVVGAT